MTKRQEGQKKYQMAVKTIMKTQGVSKTTARSLYSYSKATTRSKKMRLHWRVAHSFQADMLTGTSYRERVDYSIGKCRKITTELTKGAIPVSADGKWLKQTVVDIHAKNKSTGEMSIRTITVSDLKGNKAKKEAKRVFNDAKLTDDSKEWEVKKAEVIGTRVNRRTFGGVE